MDPQERIARLPVLKFPALKEPRSCSFILGNARSVVICGRVWRRKPFVDVLFYLCPWTEKSVSTTETLWGRSQTLYFFNIVLYFHHIELYFLCIVRHMLHGHVGFVVA